MNDVIGMEISHCFDQLLVDEPCDVLWDCFEVLGFYVI